MKAALPWLLMLYLVALHTSMAGMEIFSTAVILCILVIQFRERDFRIWHDNRVLRWWLLAMLLAVLASLLATPLLKPFWFQYGYMRWVFLLWAMTCALQTAWSDEFESRLLNLWLVLIAISGLYGTFQMVTGIDFLRKDAVDPQFGGVFRAVGFFSSSLTYAYSLGVSALAVSLPAFRRKDKRIVWAALALAASGIVASMSRGGWLAGMACMTFYVLFNHRRWILPLVLFFAATAAGLMMYADNFYRKIHGMLHLQMDHSESVRLDLWRAYWQMFLDHPIFGIGLLQGDKLLPGYYARLGVSPGYDIPGGGFEPFYSHAHNNLLQWLAGAGILGLITYLAVTFIFLRKAWRLRLKSEWGWSLFLAQVYLHIGGMSESNFINACVSHLLVFVWALILVMEFRVKDASLASTPSR
jgi:O-antigen ligase